MSANKSKNRYCLVRCWDFSLKIAVEKDCTGGILLEKICTILHTCERQWFGIKYINSKENQLWLEENKKLKLKEIEIDKASQLPVLDFCVRFHPESTRIEIQEDSTKALIFVNEVYRMAFDSQVTMLPEHRIAISAAFIYYIRNSNPSLSPSDILAKHFNFLYPQSFCVQFSTKESEWTESTLKQYDLMSQAFPHFTNMLDHILTLIEEMPMYGIYYYLITNTKKTKLYIGIECKGINIYKEDDQIEPILTFPWSELKETSISSSKITITPMDGKSGALLFNCANVKSCESLFHTIVGNHKLFANRRQVLSIFKAYEDAAKSAHLSEVKRREQIDKAIEVKNNFLTQMKKYKDEYNSTTKELIVQKEFDIYEKLIKDLIEASDVDFLSGNVEKASVSSKSDYDKFQTDSSVDTSIFFHITVKTRSERQKQHIALMQKEIDEMKIVSDQIQACLREIEKNKTTDLSTVEIPNVVTTDEQKKKKEECGKEMKKVGTILKERGTDKASRATIRIQQLEVSGGNKAATIRNLLKNNTNQRRALFEAL